MVSFYLTKLFFFHLWVKWTCNICHHCSLQHQYDILSRTFYHFMFLKSLTLKCLNFLILQYFLILWSHKFLTAWKLFLLQSFWYVTISTLPYLKIIYSFWANLLHFETISGIVSPHSPHILHFSSICSLSAALVTFLNDNA